MTIITSHAKFSRLHFVVSSYNDFSGCAVWVEYTNIDTGYGFQEFLDKYEFLDESHPRSRHWDPTRGHPNRCYSRSCALFQIFQSERRQSKQLTDPRFVSIVSVNNSPDQEEHYQVLQADRQAESTSWRGWNCDTFNDLLPRDFQQNCSGFYRDSNRSCWSSNTRKKSQI